MRYWALHAIVDSARCYPKAIRDRSHIESFARSLVKRIDMTSVANPHVHHFETGKKTGYTMVNLLENSNITARFVEETNDMYLDVFSKVPFNLMDIDQLVQIYFAPISKTSMILTRQSPIIKNETYWDDNNRMQ